MTAETLTAPEPASLPNSVRFDMASKIAGRTYRVWVFKPFGPPPEAGYPVIVTSDASLTFAIAATMSGAMGLTGGASALVLSLIHI